MRQQNHRPVEGWFFQDSANFEAQIAELDRIAWGIDKSQMAAQIPIATAKAMVSKTTRAMQTFLGNANKVINAGGSAFVRPALRAASKAVQRDYEDKIQGRLQGIIRAAESQGQKTVSSFRFNHRDIHLMLLSIVGGYEALSRIDGFKPWWLQMQPDFMIGLFASVARAAISVSTFVWEGLQEAVDRAGSTIDTITTLVKIGIGAGILYLLKETLEAANKGKD
jgi:hypothetical protein